MTSRRIHILLALILAFTLLAIPLVSAHASCYNTSCRGQDPIDMGCSGDAQTIASASSPAGEVTTYLRKSTACNAIWSKAVKGSSYPGNWMETEILECANNTCVYTKTTPPPNPPTYYYYWPWYGTQQTPNPQQATQGYFYGDMAAGSVHSCARGWVYTSNVPNFITDSRVYKSWACNQ